MPSPGDVVPYPPYPTAGASAQGGLQYSLEATQLLAKAVLEGILARLPPALATDQSLKVTLQNSIVASISGNVAVTNMIPAVETGLAKETTLAARASEATLAAASAKLPAALGQKPSAASLATSLSTEQEAVLAARASEATLAAASAKLPATLGQKPSAASLATALSTEQEAILQSVADKLEAVKGFVDGLEALLGTTNTNTEASRAAIVTLQGYVDQLEGFTDGLEALLGGTLSVSGPLTDTQLRAGDVKTRNRSEASARLLHAHGTASVAAASWWTLAAITVPTGKKYRLLMAEGDFADLGALANNRAIRVRQGVNVRATALTGGNQPNPDIEGLTLENTSGANETWDIQGRNGDTVSAQVMYGWFTWVEVSD